MTKLLGILRHRDVIASLLLTALGAGLLAVWLMRPRPAPSADGPDELLELVDQQCDIVGERKLYTGRMRWTAEAGGCKAGQPATGVPVELRLTRAAQGGGASVAGCLTDADGVYCLVALGSAGDYQVTFGPAVAEEQGRSVSSRGAVRLEDRQERVIGGRHHITGKAVRSTKGPSRAVAGVRVELYGASSLGRDAERVYWAAARAPDGGFELAAPRGVQAHRLEIVLPRAQEENGARKVWVSAVFGVVGLVVFLGLVMRLDRATKCAECWGPLKPVDKLPAPERTKVGEFVRDSVLSLTGTLESILVCPRCRFVYVCPKDMEEPLSAAGLVYGHDVYYRMHEVEHTLRWRPAARGRVIRGSCPVCKLSFSGLNPHEQNLAREKLKEAQGESTVQKWKFCRRCSEVFGWVSPRGEDYAVYRQIQ